MDLSDFRLVFDFGLVVLIWIVQIIIYPGFTYYTLGDLLKWHTLYTRRISFVVIPLMLGQLALGIWEFYSKPSAHSIGSLVLIIAVWVLTFTIFVPLHQKIADGFASKQLLNRLITKNWWRTVLWTLLFVWTGIRKLML